jgi:exodeoxyribonuclease VII small subunit
MTAADRKKRLNFEESLKKLEEIVRRLEDEQAPLEESLKLFAEGKALARACETELRNAEAQVRKLMADDRGEIDEAPLDAGDDEAQRERPAKGKKKNDDLPF